MNPDPPPDIPGVLQSSQNRESEPGASGHETISLLLQQTRPWVLVIAVLTAIGAGLMMLGGIVFGAFVAGTPEITSFDGMPRSFGGGIAALYIVFGGLYIIPSIWLFRYSGRISRYVEAPTPAALADAMRAQKSFWKFTGIAALSLIALYLVLMIGFFVVFAMMGF